MITDSIPRIVERTRLVFSDKGVDGIVCDVLYLNVLYVKHIRKKKNRWLRAGLTPLQK